MDKIRFILLKYMFKSEISNSTYIEIIITLLGFDLFEGASFEQHKIALGVGIPINCSINQFPHVSLCSFQSFTI